MNYKMASIAALAILLTGCTISKILPDPVTIRYEPGDPMPQLMKVHRTGDFAVYYDRDKNPEIPVRVHAGEKIGFVRGGDGAIKAVAGDFRMNVSTDVASAHWKRLNYADD
jgi:hypothetical protein